MEHENCDCHKTKERSPEEYKCLIHRLNRIEVKSGASGAWWKGAPTVRKILAQVAAANAALNAFSRELLAEHIRTCVARDVRRQAGDPGRVGCHNPKADEVTEFTWAR